MERSRSLFPTADVCSNSTINLEYSREVQYHSPWWKYSNHSTYPQNCADRGHATFSRNIRPSIELTPESSVVGVDGLGRHIHKIDVVKDENGELCLPALPISLDGWKDASKFHHHNMPRHNGPYQSMGPCEIRTTPIDQLYSHNTVPANHRTPPDRVLRSAKNSIPTTGTHLYDSQTSPGDVISDDESSYEADLDEDEQKVSYWKRQGFVGIGDRARITSLFMSRFRMIEQLPCKTMDRRCIEHLIEGRPKKFPYDKLNKVTKDVEFRCGVKPDFWPRTWEGKEVRYVGTDLRLKWERIAVLCHIFLLPLTHTDEYRAILKGKYGKSYKSWEEYLKKVTSDQECWLGDKPKRKGDDPDMFGRHVARQETVKELVRIAAKVEKYVNGEVDKTHRMAYAAVSDKLWVTAYRAECVRRHLRQVNAQHDFRPTTSASDPDIDCTGDVQISDAAFDMGVVTKCKTVEMNPEYPSARQSVSLTSATTAHNRPLAPKGTTSLSFATSDTGSSDVAYEGMFRQQQWMPAAPKSQEPSTSLIPIPDYTSSSFSRKGSSSTPIVAPSPKRKRSKPSLVLTSEHSVPDSSDQGILPLSVHGEEDLINIPSPDPTHFTSAAYAAKALTRPTTCNPPSAVSSVSLNDGIACDGGTPPSLRVPRNGWMYSPTMDYNGCDAQEESAALGSTNEQPAIPLEQPYAQSQNAAGGQAYTHQSMHQSSYSLDDNFTENVPPDTWDKWQKVLDIGDSQDFVVDESERRLLFNNTAPMGSFFCDPRAI